MRDARLKSLQDKQAQALALGAELARRYAVEDLLRSEGIEVPDGTIGLAPVSGVGLVKVKKRVQAYTKEVREIDGISRWRNKRSGYKEEVVERTQRAITGIRINGGEPVKLSKPINLDEWSKKYGSLLKGKELDGS
jgi:hypothetical protein